MVITPILLKTGYIEVVAIFLLNDICNFYTNLYELKDKGCISIAKPFKNHMTHKMETTLEETTLCRKNMDLITMILEQ